MIKATGLKIEYADVVFQDVSFMLGNGEKVGLVGLNGCGKSTLMKVIAGLERADAGKIELVEEKIGYLPQELNLDEEQFVGEYLESLVENHLSDFWKVEVVLSRLGVVLTGHERAKPHQASLQPLDFYRLIGTLSDGQKMKLYLCRLLLEESTILLLDEPTNHLDIDGITWLESFLERYEGIVIVVSHDRLFLNNLIDTVFEIDEKTLHVFPGNYDDYLDGKQEWIEKREQEYLLQGRKLEKLEARLELVRKFSSGKKQKAMIKAVKKRIEREVTNVKVEKYFDQKLSGINIAGETHAQKIVMKFQDVSFAYKDNQILQHADLEIYGQDKVWFYGPNGIGKSTMVKLLVSELQPNEGKVKIGENIRYDYFSQNQAHLPNDMSVREFLLKFGKVDYDKSFGTLERFLFPKHLQDHRLGSLSPGQRARLSFAVFTLHEYELLILDEPTNHLDIRTKQVIEEALSEYAGTILLISHDRYFVEQVGVNRGITLRDGKFIGVNYLA